MRPKQETDARPQAARKSYKKPSVKPVKLFVSLAYCTDNPHDPLCCPGGVCGPGDG